MEGGRRKRHPVEYEILSRIYQHEHFNLFFHVGIIIIKRRFNGMKMGYVKEKIRHVYIMKFPFSPSLVFWEVNES